MLRTRRASVYGTVDGQLIWSRRTGEVPVNVALVEQAVNATSQRVRFEASSDNAETLRLIKRCNGEISRISDSFATFDTSFLEKDRK